MTARLVVHVQPRAAKSEVKGRHGDAVRVRLQAAPVDGAANDELVRLLAETLGVSRQAVRIVRGHAARRKTIEVDGLDETALRARLA